MKFINTAIRLAPIFLAIFVALLPISQPYASQHIVTYEEQLDIEREKLIHHIGNIRKSLSQFGDASVKSLEKSVTFEARNEHVPNAWVSWRNNSSSRTITITPSYRLVITYLADMDVAIIEDINVFECRAPYVNELFKTLALNRIRMSKGESVFKIPAPETFFAATSISKCRHLKDKFPIAEKHRVGRDLAVNNVITLAYLHELGHVALNHNPINLSDLESLPASQRLPTFIKAMTKSRQMEYAADDWAIDRYVDVFSNPISILTNVISSFYLVFGGHDCSLEAADSHPNGYQRFARQMSRMRDRATRIGKFPNHADASKLVDDFTALATKAQEKLNCPR